MAGGIWLGSAMHADTQYPRKTNTANVSAVKSRLTELEDEIQRMKLMNQALWELLQERARFTDADLEAKVEEIDLRDGVADGKMTQRAMRCPQCNRVSSTRHWRCIYCGLEFERPVMG